MQLTKKERILVFALGIYLQELRSRVDSENLDVSVQKSVFIDFVLKTRLFEKKERALYKNLENLEKKKLSAYPVKRMMLTAKGWKEFARIKGELSPYFTVQYVLEKSDIVKETGKIQAVFKE